MTTRVVVADDQVLVRAGLRTILGAEPDIEVVGEAADGTTAVALAAQLQPDVVLMDIRMPGCDGIAATEQIVDANPTVRVLILSTFDLDEYVYRALCAGACGFLVKDTGDDELVDAVRAAVKGDTLLAPSVTKLLVESFTRQAPALPPPPELASLTPREREVWQLVAAGLNNQEIGHRLFVSEATAKTHVGRLLAKLNARDRVQLVVLAHRYPHA